MVWTIVLIVEHTVHVDIIGGDEEEAYAEVLLGTVLTRDAHVDVFCHAACGRCFHHDRGVVEHLPRHRAVAFEVDRHLLIEVHAA